MLEINMKFSQPFCSDHSQSGKELKPSFRFVKFISGQFQFHRRRLLSGQVSYHIEAPMAVIGFLKSIPVS